MTITAKYNGTCRICRQPLLAGMTIEYVKGLGASCPEGTSTCVPTLAPPPTGDLLRVVTHLQAQKDAGKLTDFTGSLLEQFERKGSLSDRQVEAVLRKLDKDLFPGPDVLPAGRYAIDLDGQWRLFKVWRGKRDPNAVGVYEITANDEKVKSRVQTGRILGLIAQDAGKAAAEYGHRTGRCSRCSIPMRNNLSRKLGIGPDCLVHWYGDEAGQLKADARDELRAAGIDPYDNYDNLQAVAA